MAAAGLPLLAHTGGEHTVPIINPALADPKLLRFPLECGVTVIAAHCGTSQRCFRSRLFRRLGRDAAQKFPNLYGDISALVSLNRCGHLRDCLRDEISPTDFARERFSRASARPSPLDPRMDRSRHISALSADPQSARARLAVQTRAWISGGDGDARSEPATTMEAKGLVMKRWIARSAARWWQCDSAPFILASSDGALDQP